MSDNILENNNNLSLFNENRGVPLIKGAITNSKNIFIEEFLLFHNRKNEMDLYVSEERMKHIEFEIKDKFLSHWIIGQFKMEELRTREGFFLEIPSYKFSISDSVYEKFGKEFYINATKGKFKIEYTLETEELTITEFELMKFNVELDDWINFRKKYGLYDWINELLKIIGLNGNTLLFREKIILLARMLPMIEKKFYLLEFGPKSVGKTTSFDIFPENATIKDTTAKAPELIYNKSTKKNGVIFNTDVLVIDEAKNNKMDSELATELQSYLSSGKIRRVQDAPPSEISASIVFLGNYNAQNYRDIYKNSTPSMIENISLGEDTAAMFDRFNYFNPSWGMRRIASHGKLADEFKNSNSYVPISYFSSILKKLRNSSFDVDEFLKKRGYEISLDLRVATSIKRTFSGFLKLLFPEAITNPNYNLESCDIEMLLFLALEGRCGIDCSLSKFNGNEFKNINYKILGIKNSGVDLLKHATRLFMNYYDFNIISHHRGGFLNQNGDYTKFSLDNLGIEENKAECIILPNLFNNAIQPLIDDSYLSIIINQTHTRIPLSGNTNVFYPNNFYVFESNMSYLYGYTIDNLDFMTLGFDNNFLYNLAILRRQIDFKCECNTNLPFYYHLANNFEFCKCQNCRREYYTSNMFTVKK